ncbi:SpoVA/SpoVAEb family sporulation membrane protein [Lacrimispora sp. 210928-DFI.3.58]|uniref:SpoVA/SpoVAEb family sporulation membrane protein n=1 Tax=Lacrimispora sp. 210928-DFI.3.58 TaxID=2883214 RepID=UPI0015B5DFC4|nr:SpoVA/SpoVAEb family sporulation membrane protein [Lacrimispora sp. 210928-DFI.3.58]MCB7317766.1 SpoVA/SpoVAEb family sporulation membrane protein [Lacrimispora sp. 210928-DFI.3.58]
MEIDKKKYEQYVKEITPIHNLWASMAKAFLIGGLICLLGQCLMTFMTETMKMDKESASAWTSLELILLSVLLTGFNLYPKLVKYGGAGALVPITGFANSVVAPAIEFQAEGQVFGVGCKIFTIAGPVILYGILSSWALGVVYWIGGMMGIFQI